MKLTPWFDGTIKPVHIGVYQQKSANGMVIGYQYWDGRRWYNWGRTIQIAEHYYKCRIGIDRSHQKDPWRGLTTKG